MRYYLLVFVFIMLSSCNEKEPVKPQWQPTPYAIDIPRYFPTKLNIPADNPMTVEGIALGRYLFYDGRLSGRTDHDSLMTCASCHVQSYNFRPGLSNPAFNDGMPVGIKGVPTSHAALPLINLIWNSNGYTWNGAVHSSGSEEAGATSNIERIVLETILHPTELAGDLSKTVEMIQGISGYPELFYKAFGSNEVTADRIAKAISQFVRTLISTNSRFDQYMRGELQLTTEELEGLILFTTEEGADCFHCHGSEGNLLFTTNLFYNNGKDTVFNSTDDRYIITGNNVDIGAYKATTLRNIAMGGPYMHDGRFKTLDDVINYYSHDVKMSAHINPLMHHASNGGVQLTPIEKASLKAFLTSLTDEQFLTNPDFAAPAVFPDGKLYDEVKGKY
jgi:cytochrome c peroxidase